MERRGNASGSRPPRADAHPMIRFLRGKHRHRWQFTPPAAPAGLVFQSRRGKALHDQSLSGLMPKLGITAVPHGFRSSFRDWAPERTDHPPTMTRRSMSLDIRSSAPVTHHLIGAFHAAEGLHSRKVDPGVECHDRASFLEPLDFAVVVLRQGICGQSRASLVSCIVNCFSVDVVCGTVAPGPGRAVDGEPPHATGSGVVGRPTGGMRLPRFRGGVNAFGFTS